jgi:hypothetical protein
MEESYVVHSRQSKRSWLDSWFPNGEDTAQKRVWGPKAFTTTIVSLNKEQTDTESLKPFFIYI